MTPVVLNDLFVPSYLFLLLFFILKNDVAQRKIAVFFRVIFWGEFRAQIRGTELVGYEVRASLSNFRKDI